MSLQPMEMDGEGLAQHEAVIARGLETFVEVGEALAAIRDERLYRETHGTFEDYCRDRWGFTPQHAGRLMIGASVARQVEPIGSIPNEAQARELARVPESERAEVWRETLDRTDGKPTAAAVREVVRPATRPAPAPTPEPEPFDVEPDSIDGYVEDVPPEAFMPAPDPAPSVEQFLDSSEGLQDARYRQAHVDVLAKMPAVSRFDADRLAPLLTEEHVWLTEELAKSLASFATALRQRRSGLRVVNGGSQ